MLELLKNITKIGEFPVVVMDELKEKYPERFNEKGGMDYQWFEETIRPTNHVYVRRDVNSISFTLQKGLPESVMLERMLPDFKYYIAQLTGAYNGEWDTAELHNHALRCIEENSRDWQDFCMAHVHEYTGINGCRVDTLMRAARDLLVAQNEICPTKEMAVSIGKLDEAILWLEKLEYNIYMKDPEIDNEFDKVIERIAQKENGKTYQKGDKNARTARS